MKQRGDPGSGKSARGNAGAFKPGDDPRRGKGPPKGSGGRPTNRFKRLMRKHALSAAEGKAFRRILRGQVARDSDFLRALQFAAEHGFGKPTETQVLDVKGSLEQILAASREAEGAERKRKKRSKRP